MSLYKTPFLAIPILLLCAQLAFPYTAILKNGKKIEGLLIREDGDQICIQDKDGIKITIRRTNLDEEATLKSNKATELATEKESEKDQLAGAASSKSKTLAELGRETRAKRTGKSKVLTKKDLADLPEITVMGNKIIDTSELPDPGEDKDAEKAWKDAAMELYKLVEATKQQYFALKQQCDELSMAAGFATDYFLQGGGPIGSSVIAQAAEACGRMQEAEGEMIAAQQEYEAFQDDARQKGILPAWVDPERF